MLEVSGEDNIFSVAAKSPVNLFGEMLRGVDSTPNLLFKMEELRLGPVLRCCYTWEWPMPPLKAEWICEGSCSVESKTRKLSFVDAKVLLL